MKKSLRKIERLLDDLNLEVTLLRLRLEVPYCREPSGDASVNDGARLIVSTSADLGGNPHRGRIVG